MLAPYRGMGAGSALLQKCLEVVTSQLPEVHEAVLHVQVGGWCGEQGTWVDPWRRVLLCVSCISCC